MPKLEMTNKASIRAFQTAMAEHMKVLADEWGVTVSPAGGQMASTEFTGKFSFKAKDVDGSAEKAEFARFAGMFSMEASDYKRRFVSRRDTYELIGFMPNRPKFAFRGRNVATGKELLFPSVNLI